jgi:23S rRNA pseudouridine2605 synthase/23S rRNA pseudouridine2604 synthase
MEKIRLQKYLSEAGICSRRKWEEYISKWLVTVNWKVAEIWCKVDPESDKIKLLDEAVKMQNKYVYYKINKPRWVVSTCAQKGEVAIVDIVDTNERVFPIWRLDKETTWLILLTNDWRLANFLMHPRYEHEKEYVVKTFGPISDAQLEKMRNWIFILGRKTKKCKIKRLASGVFSIILTEWRNRQIRRMVSAVWSDVKTLKRIRIENIELSNMYEWEYKHLSNKEIKNLFKSLSIENE